MAFIKHVGRHSGTGQRLSVAFLQLPDDKENSLVVYSDSLPDRYHDDFMAAVESPESQEAPQLYEVLALSYTKCLHVKYSGMARLC